MEPALQQQRSTNLSDSGTQPDNTYTQQVKAFIHEQNLKPGLGWENYFVRQFSNVCAIANSSRHSEKNEEKENVNNLPTFYKQWNVTLSQQTTLII